MESPPPNKKKQKQKKNPLKNNYKNINIKFHKRDSLTSKDMITLNGLTCRYIQSILTMTAIALVSVINHYYINELHLFRDIQEKRSRDTI